MAEFLTEYITDLAKPPQLRTAAHQFAMGDNNAYTFTALVCDSADPEAGLLEGTVSGTALRPDGTTVALEGVKGADQRAITINGVTLNATPCSVTLPQACFAYPGRVLVSIKLVTGTTATTVLSVSGTVIRTETDAAVDPGEILPDLAELQAAAAEALDAAGEAREVMEEAESVIESMPAIFPQEAKMALLTCLTKVAWTDEHGQDYYDALYAALFPEVYVVSISATYTQTGEVMDTDTLDSLRADLVVTAHYNTGIVTPVSNYTLAGDLTAGECTILVMYANFTTSFTVEVVGVPSGYTQYDYLQSGSFAYDASTSLSRIVDTGLSAGYCDTRYVHELGFWFTDQPRDRPTTNGIFGARPATGSSGSALGVTMFALYSKPDKIAVSCNGGDSGYALSCAWGTNHTLRLDSGNVIIDDVIATTLSGTRETFTTCNIWLFGVSDPSPSGNSGICFSEARISSYKVTDSQTGEVIAEMVPCTNPNSVPGFYDKIRRAFYSAVDTSVFSCGNEV